LLKVALIANCEIRSICISTQLLTDKEQLEDYLILALNKANDKAGTIHETKITAVAKEGMPDIPGMEGLFK